MPPVARTLLVGLVLLVAGWFALGAGNDAEDSSGVQYFVELDNAFGLIEGADVKVAGVRAGKISSMELDRSDMRAKIGLDITQEGFDSFRSDVFCETRPQSLIGEYFVDCKPGTSSRKLPEGSTVPVEQTGSTVPVDLINNIMRRPYRDRYRIILGELGAGLAARGGDLNETIRRAVPALREVDRVLAILATERKTIRALYDDAETVVGRLADRRTEVTRFIREARDTQVVQARRARELRAQFQRLPRFLAELAPTMRTLGRAAEQQRPTFAALRRAAPGLERFLGALGPFAEASRPATRALAAAGREGRPAVAAARPNVRRLTRATATLPEWSKNLAITLEHLDDPAFAVEKDPRSPRGGSGYTGLEALLRYVFWQGQAINTFDGDGHLLKVSAFLSQCAFYADAEDAKDPALDKCAAILGPNRPGINSPDPTKTAAKRSRKATQKGADRKPAAQEAPAAADAPAATPPAAAPPSPAPKLPGLPIVPPAVQDLLDDIVPDTQLGPRGAEGLLDYLLGR